MDEAFPKYSLVFMPNSTVSWGDPFIIYEHAFINDRPAQKLHGSFRHLNDALEALGALTQKPVTLAFSEELVFRS